MPRTRSLRPQATTISLALLLCIPLSIVLAPTARAGGVHLGGHGEGYAVCDVIATRCAGAAAFAGSQCVNGAFNLGLFGRPNVTFCTAASGAIAVAAALDIPVGSVLGYAQVGTASPAECSDQRNLLSDTLVWASTVCSEYQSCGQASAWAMAANGLGALTTPTAGATLDCDLPITIGPRFAVGQAPELASADPSLASPGCSTRTGGTLVRMGDLPADARSALAEGLTKKLQGSIIWADATAVQDEHVAAMRGLLLDQIREIVEHPDSPAVRCDP